MGSTRTSTLTRVMASEALPSALELTLHDDGLFRDWSGEVRDLGGDPGDWVTRTPDHVGTLRKHHTLRTTGIVTSAARLREAEVLTPTLGRRSVGAITLADLYAATEARIAEGKTPHPHMVNVPTLETIREAYAAHRAADSGAEA